VVFSLAIATIIGVIFSFQPDLIPFLQPAIARYLKFNPPTAPKITAKARQSQLQPQINDLGLLQSGTYILGGTTGASKRIDNNYGEAAVIPNFSKPLPEKLRSLLDNIVQELRELGGVMVLGSAIAAAIQVLAPRELIIGLGAGPVSSILAMLVLAGVVSICSTVDSFFALSFASTFTSGSLLAFLVFGPMIDIKSIGLMLSIFKPKALIYLFILAGQLTLLFTLFLNLQVI
jgi:hypothetical protein